MNVHAMWTRHGLVYLTTVVHCLLEVLLHGNRNTVMSTAADSAYTPPAYALVYYRISTTSTFHILPLKPAGLSAQPAIYPLAHLINHASVR